MNYKIEKDNIFAIASYIISLNKKFFLSDEMIKIGKTKNKTNNGRLWLNKYLHIISAEYNYYYKKEINTGGRQWKALSNGGVIIDSTNNWMAELAKINVIKSNLLSKKMKDFVDEILDDLSHSDIKRLINLAHEDKNWKEAWENSKNKSNESESINDEFNFSRA